MPHITVKLAPGRSEQLKRQLAGRIVQDVIAVLKCGEEAVSLAIEEVPLSAWPEQVYWKEIIDHPGLYQKPGYTVGITTKGKPEFPIVD